MAIRQMTREQFEQEFGVKPKAQPTQDMAKNKGFSSLPQDLESKEKRQQLSNFGIGFGKQTLSTLQNIGNVLAKPFGKLVGQEFGIPEQKLELEGGAQKAGGFASDVTTLLAPSPAKGLGFAGRFGTRAIQTGGTVAAQQGEVGAEAGIAAGAEVALPVAGKFIVKPILGIAGRLARSIGAGLSGVSSKALGEIIENPKIAQQAVKQLEQSGQRKVLTENVETMLNGVRTIKREARKAFGEGLQALKKEDINNKVFRRSIQPFLDEIGSNVKGQFRVLKNVEFDEAKNIKKASNLIDDLSTTKLDGLSLRNLLNKIEKERYKIATSDERLAFNTFISNLSKTVKSAINDSTDKLGEINRKFSADMQLAEAVEDIFGRVKFGGNLSEVRKASEKLEQLFSKKGLTPEIIDDFLKRIEVEPSNFRTKEATRQISDTAFGKTTEGVTISEITRGLSGAIIPPQKVRDIAIFTGLAEDVIKPVLDKVAPASRATLIRLLTGFTD